ncbi:cell division protein ZapA [bacterium]|nr:cell division protein ZapA [bacterium]
MGDQYPIKSDADAEYLRKLAKYVEEKIQAVSSKSKLPQQLKTEVLAALLIADELFSEKEKNARTEERLQQVLSVLEERLHKERND